MPLRNTPIRRKLMTIMLLTSGLVLLLTCVAFFAYEFQTFRRTSLQQLSTLGEIIATNSTAALAFENPDDAKETLAALRAEPNVVAATLYDQTGQVFAHYPDSLSVDSLPAQPGADGYRFEAGRLIGFEPVIQSGTRRLGTLYLAAGMGALFARLRLYGGIAAAVFFVSLLLAYLISRKLQQQITTPILELAQVANAVSERQDYSVRASLRGADEVGKLTTAFNQMLAQLQQRNAERKQADEKIQAQLARHDLLNRITRAVGDRQDLPSIFEVVVRSLEENLPLDFGCVCTYDPVHERLTVSGLGRKGEPLAIHLGLDDNASLAVDRNGLSRCVQGHLVYEPDVSRVESPFPKRLGSLGFKSLVAAPLLLESRVFGILLAARREPHAFSSMDCDFLRQLSEHVALAAHQAQVNTALQQAYDDLRQSQQAVLQQERLRALGEMASGIAHDINNAISPVMLYTQSLLESESGLSATAREYLQTIERAIEDVAETVARMREFYRQRQPQLSLTPADMNSLVTQVMQLTQARWRDIPQQRGVAIEARLELAPGLPAIMGAESEIREALTNLVFNAVDAMPHGGILTLRTAISREDNGDGPSPTQVLVEVGDTGLGMDEATRQRCLEPFFTTKGERGTGLGLAMVYGTVQRHSADIAIESVPGKGTTVRLSFAVPVDPRVDQPAAAAYTVPTRMRLLVVDDDPLLLKSLRDTLEADGHVVVTANGGQEGVTTFSAALSGAEPFAAVITDLGMPYVDGRQVASMVKQASPATPVIMLTGWGQRILAEGEIPPHVDRLISKPPKLRDLREALAQLAGPG